MYFDLSISELAEKIRSKEVSSRELVAEAYRRIKKYDKDINSVITLIPEEEAITKAGEIDRNLNKYPSPVAGIPYTMKDAYVTKNVRTTAGSKVLNDFIPSYSSTVYKRLEERGAILIGKMNMDAWGHGASTENTDFGATKNPWDLARSAGGSGGGPAAALSAGMTVFAIGEDTGGSIRNPAAWNNISAMKVSYGRVSRYGAIAYASSLDTVGPTAKSVEDCAYVLNEIAGFDPYDATSSKASVPNYVSSLSKSVKGKKIAVPKEFFGKGLDTEVKFSVLKTLDVWASLGVKTEEISLPMLEYCVPMYYILVTSETSSNLGRYDGIRFGTGRGGFSGETKRRIMTGTYALSAGYYDEYYKKAQRARTLLIDVYTKCLKDFDAILAPVNSTLPPKLGELVGDPVRNMMADLYTGLINIIGLPSLAIPSGFSKSGLPIGMQLIGNMFSEDTLFCLGYHYQGATDWHKRSPKIIS